MSVINEMLRDLDRRHARQPPVEVGSIHVVAPVTRMSWRGLLLLMLAGVAVIAGSFSVIAPRLQHADVAIAPPASSAAATAPTVSTTPVAPTPTTASVTAAASTPAERAKREPAAIASENVATPAVVSAPIAEPAITEKPANVPENKSASSEAPLSINNQSTNAQPTNAAQPLRKQVSQSPEALAEAAYRQGEQMLREGRSLEAEREFANALAANPDALELRLLSARVQLQNGDAATALQTLRARNPELHSHSDYYAVMAALEQQLGDFRGAAEHYRALLNVDASRAAWWLGFALAQENLRAVREAIDGYRRALALNDLPAAARDFAQQRLRALE